MICAKAGLYKEKPILLIYFGEDIWITNSNLYPLLGILTYCCPSGKQFW